MGVLKNYVIQVCKSVLNQGVVFMRGVFRNELNGNHPECPLSDRKDNTI